MCHGVVPWARWECFHPYRPGDVNLKTIQDTVSVRCGEKSLPHFSSAINLLHHLTISPDVLLMLLCIGARQPFAMGMTFSVDVYRAVLGCPRNRNHYCRLCPGDGQALWIQQRGHHKTHAKNTWPLWMKNSKIADNNDCGWVMPMAFRKFNNCLRVGETWHTARVV